MEEENGNISRDLLGIKITGSSFDSSSHMGCTGLRHLFGEAKVTDLCIHLHVQKDVAGLYIPVNDSWIASIM